MSFWKSKARPEAARPRVHPSLTQCQEDRTLLTFTSGDPPSLMHGRLARILEKHLVVELEGLDHGEKPVVGHVVCCNYSHGARSGAFFARLHHWAESDDRLQMVLEHPSEVLYLDVRRAFRVPTASIRWLACSLQAGDSEQLAQVLDVSRLGLGLAATGAGIHRGQTVELTISTDGAPIQLQAEVAVVKQDFVGVSIDEASEAWLDLVSRLERDWMRRNRG